jgi:brefeldin A-inhibited guanine nucleotide-exchange protein
LYNSLEKHGGKFSPGLWSLIFKGVLIPLLDELRHLEVFVEKGARASPKLPLPAPSTTTRIQYRPGQATSTYCLQRLLECFGMYYDVVGFLPEVLFLLGKCMDTTDMEEELAAASATSLEQMLVAHGHKFPEGVWGLIADELRSVMTRAEPTWIFFMNDPPAVVRSSPPAAPASPTAPVSQPSPMSPGLLSPRLPSVIAMYPNVVRVLDFHFPSDLPPKVVTETEVNAQRFPSRTHLAVILALQHVLGHVLASRSERRLALSEGHVSSLMSCLRESFQFARKVNDAVELRLHLQRAGWSYGKADASDLPSLLLQEVEGKRQFLHVLLSLIREASAAAARREDARRHMTQLLKQTLQEYLTWTIADGARGLAFPHVAVPVDATQRAARYAPLLVGALSELAEFDGDEVGARIIVVVGCGGGMAVTDADAAVVAAVGVDAADEAAPGLAVPAADGAHQDAERRRAQRARGRVQQEPPAVATSRLAVAFTMNESIHHEQGHPWTVTKHLKIIRISLYKSS